MAGLKRRAAAAGVAVAVLLGHAWVGWSLADSLAGWGDADRPAVQRMDVAFVRELTPQAPPAVVAPPPPKPRPRVAQAAAPAASAASAPPQVPAASAPEPPPETASEPATEPAGPVTPVAAAEEAPAASMPASAPEPAAVAAVAPASAPASAASFDWPPSTRLRYTLVGQYRGEVHGSAQVQWVRRGERYQVHLDVAVGPSFAPLLARRMTSDGRLTDQGLAPERYDEETKTLFNAPRRLTMRFGPDRIELANGTSRPAPPGVQDTASQFVQLTWLFTTQPDRLRAGQSVAQPLALPRRVDPWVYDVLGAETLDTPVGPLDTVHVKPRRESMRPGELGAEMWIAPSLQYLPVRIRIEQDDRNFIDLLIDSAPLQAEPG